MIFPRILKALQGLSDEQLLYLRSAIVFEFQRRQPPYPTKTPIALYWENLFKEDNNVSDSDRNAESSAA